MSSPPARSLTVFGGSFDPPHVCHLLACTWILATHPTTEVLVLPAAEHPLGKEITSFPHRFAMCKAAFAVCGPRVEVSDLEARRPGPSYTIDTLRILSTLHPERPLILAVGSDVLARQTEWKDFPAILKLATLLVLPRGAGETPFFLPDLSSTLIRNRLRSGDSLSDLVPAEVLAYLTVHHLYAEASGGGGVGDSR
ncbi:MAG: hypothetical protein A2559_02325 [Deltaproteobacteria bacterium RIFOXYD2_FULL_66_9]|nr:MAG: hypothetical protein A2559_02325 [Deltaproteobacteria bacterium RIFOXYD2_FULL_66_9]